jgi:hypothetical protein
MRETYGGVPTPALVLGIAATAPFVAAALAMLAGPAWLKITAYIHLMNYAALGLVFLGAVHWGLALAAGRTDWTRYAAAVVPLVLGWLALSLIQPLPTILVFVVGYAGIFILDIRAARDGFAPPWYPRLRKPLTIVVLLAFFAVGLATTVFNTG